MLAPNTVLQNRYQIVRVIGRGGMGAVYQAIDERLGNTVALKETLFSDETLRSAFHHEARLLASLRHPALPKVSDHFTEVNGQFLVMEFIPGEDLATLQEKHGKLSVDLVLQWCDQLLDALDYLHTHEPPIVHRDIKPQNLKLTPRGEIILLDFGLAKTTHSIIAGYTPYYAPLEQIQGSGTDARSDLFALAATIYHLLTGVRPPSVLKRAEQLLKGESDPLQQTQELNQLVPPGIDAILRKAMSLNRDNRPISAAVMRSDMKQATINTRTDPIFHTVAPVASIIQQPVETQWQHRYVELHQIGEGGMGKTFRALDRQTNQSVCLKKIKPQVDERILLQECRALARLNHQNIVRLLDFDARMPSPYLVMEFIDGPTLAGYLNLHAPLTEPVVIGLARQLFAALQYAHEQMIIHCDLKPNNILLTLHGSEVQPKILDYGLSIVDRQDASGAITAIDRIAGTLNYMAPEQYKGVMLSEACDTYAIGQMLWEMLAGRPAFTGTAQAVVNTKQSIKDGLDIYQQMANVSEPLARLIRRCTQPLPQLRPKAAEALTILNEIKLNLSAPVVAAPLNLGFDLPSNDRQPPGWFNSIGFVDGVSTRYKCNVIRRQNNSACLQFHSVNAGADEFGSVMQRCPIYQLAGQSIRFEGRVRTRELNQWAGLWLRIDDQKQQMLFFDNMSSRPIKDAPNWQGYSITTQLPKDAYWLNYGILLVGDGTLWIDDLQIMLADKAGNWRPLTLWQERGYSLPDSDSFMRT